MMAIAIIGLGIQGQKRRIALTNERIITVDPYTKSDYNYIQDVPLDSYTAAVVCVPEKAKQEIINYLAIFNKHMLIEKPLSVSADLIESLKYKSNDLVIQTAYNHRFEPNIVKAREIIQAGIVGEIYSVRLFYGNGTVQHVIKSWRNTTAGIIEDLGPHLIDIFYFLMDTFELDITHLTQRAYESKCFDWAHIHAKSKRIAINMTMSYLSWRNSFELQILGSKGSIHIESLCKWGPATLTYRERVFPSGEPISESTTLIMKDPTWAAEMEDFLGKIRDNSCTSHSVLRDEHIKSLLDPHLKTND